MQTAVRYYADLRTTRGQKAAQEAWEAPTALIALLPNQWIDIRRTAQCETDEGAYLSRVSMDPKIRDAALERDRETRPAPDPNRICPENRNTHNFARAFQSKPTPHRADQ